jgi:hypothetical protein
MVLLDIVAVPRKLGGRGLSGRRCVFRGRLCLVSLGWTTGKIIGFAVGLLLIQDIKVPILHVGQLLTAPGRCLMRQLTVLGVSLITCTILSGTAARGDLYFADNFNGPTFNPNLVDIEGAYTFSGGTTGNSAATRAYVRTVESNYISVDFQADLIYSISGSGPSPGVFFGIGPATEDGAFFNEPEAALYLLDHTNGFPFWPASDIVVRRNAPGPGNFFDHYNLPFPDGAVYARILKIGDSMTLSFDHSYNGSSFVPDGSFTLSLSSVAPYLTTGPSYLFFGTGFDSVSPSRFNSIVVTGIPEAPALIVWSAISGLTIGIVALRKRLRYLRPPVLRRLAS